MFLETVEAHAGQQISTGDMVPAVIGSKIAGTFADASGHSGQSHLFYAANAGVWWLLTLTSSADSQGGANHLVKAYYSSGPDLASATWTLAANSPGASTSASVNCGNCFMGGGRALGVAYINNSPVDVVHAEIAMAFDGQDSLTAHIRATVTATTITWGTWTYYDAPAAIWTVPRAVTLGVSTGKLIHSGGPILQQEVDANIRVSTTADTGGSWTSGFSAVALVDNSMFHQSNSMTFAALASNRMLSVYDNGGGQAPCYLCTGGVPEPNLSNLGYKRSNPDGSWPMLPVGGQGVGDGKVFATDATIDHNDWAIVSVDTTTVHAFRRNAAGTGLDAATYNAGLNAWTAFPSPPPFGAGQSHKAGSGVFGAPDGSRIFLAVIGNDAANSILYTKYEAGAWNAWAPVPGTDTGTHVRNFISGYAKQAAGQIGVIWTEGPTTYDVVTTSIPLASIVPNLIGLTQTAAVTALAGAGLTVGTVATASSTTVPIGSVIGQSLAALSQVAAGTSVDIVVSSGITVPSVLDQDQGAAQATIAGTAGLSVGAITSAASDTVPPGLVISQSPAAGTSVSGGSTVDFVVSSGLPIVPHVIGLTQPAATASIASAQMVVGTLTNEASATVAVGLVISQTPAAGSPVVSGSAIDLVISLGPAPIPAPNVVNTTETAAGAAITAAGLNVGAITRASSTTVAAGAVIGQDPAAGTLVPANGAINLVVSTGLPRVSVPNVVGLALAAASSALQGAGVVAGTTTHVASATVPAGAVASQSPAAGAQVAAGSAVDLSVSSGPPQVIVPGVVNLAQSAAASAITGAGLTLGATTNASSATVPAGVVISQSPAAGTQIAAGSAVSLVVSSGLALAAPIVDKVVFADGNNTRTTQPFSTTTTNELLVAFVSSDGPSTSTQTATVTGAGLTWTLVRRSNTQAGTSEVWQAKAAAQLTNVKVTSTLRVSGFQQSLTVVAFRGASGIGASAIAAAAAGAPNATLVTTKANSLVYGVGNDWDRAVARTLGTGQVIVHQAVVTSVNDTFWVQGRNGAVPSPGTSVLVNCAAPTNDRWNLVAVEIVP